MKTLQDSLKDIQNAKMSVAAKKVACLKLGLTQADIYSLEFAGFFKTAKRTATKKITLTFGVEIECIVPASRVRTAAAANGLRYEYQSYNHTDNREYFKFVTDGSIDDDIREGGRNNGIECVSPILNDTPDGMAKLQNCVKALNDAGASVNRSCGLHVHVGVQNLKDNQIVNIYKNYQKLERLIDSFMAPSRREHCQWACSMRTFNFDACTTPRELSYMIGTRYCKVNPESYYRHKTVEFRQHQGTTDFKKISMWVSFCTKLVAWSMDNVFDHDITAIADVPFLTASERDFFASRIAVFAC